MKPVALTVLRRPARFSAVIVVMICAGLLAACSGAPLPFSKAREAPPGRAPPPVVVGAIDGLPDGQAAAVFGALVRAGAQRGIAVGQDRVEDGHTLVGQFETRTTGTATTIRYRWTLTDPTDRVLHRIEETEAAPPSAGFDRDVVMRIAAYTAESLASRFSQLGYASRAAGLPPPLDHMAQAGPDAEREIDYETLHGPYMAASGPWDGSQPPVPQEAPHDKAASPAQFKADREPWTGSSARSIRGVAVTGVTGAGRTGNGELANALKQVLTEAGWPVEDQARDGVLAIEGDVSVGQSDGRAQKVALRWTVKAPDGAVLGTVEQANDVPAGSLDSGWGDAAHHAAQAAAMGIFDLVDKLR
jgi:hypothetical protein